MLHSRLVVSIGRKGLVASHSNAGFFLAICCVICLCILYGWQPEEIPTAVFVIATIGFVPLAFVEWCQYQWRNHKLHHVMRVIAYHGARRDAEEAALVPLREMRRIEKQLLDEQKERIGTYLVPLPLSSAEK